MTMKFGTRIVFSAFIIIVVIFCFFLLGTLIGAVDIAMLNDIVGTMGKSGELGYKFLYGVVLVAMIGVGICLLFFGMIKETPKTATVAVLENGSILISVKAVEDLVQKYIREKPNVKGIHTRVISHGETVEIKLEISVVKDTDIPTFTKELQQGLTEYVQKTTGLTVDKNEIMVITVDDHKAGEITEA